MKIDNLSRRTEELKEPVRAEQAEHKPKEEKGKKSYEDFLSKRGEQVGKELKMRRSVSAEKKLSRSGSGRMVSPSPKKEDKWGASKKEERKPEKHRQMIPPSRGQVGPHNNLHVGGGEEQQRRARSLNMEEIKKIRVIQIDPPKEKKYRRAEEKDRLLLEFLGINV
jgi:hypothetical protein